MTDIPEHIVELVAKVLMDHPYYGSDLKGYKRKARAAIEALGGERVACYATATQPNGVLSIKSGPAWLIPLGEEGEDG